MLVDRELEIVTPDGSMSTFVTHPGGGSAHPVVLFFMDAPGKRDELHDMARRLGAAGYYVMLPNLYYRSTCAFDASDDLVGRAAEVRALIATLTFETVACDTSALLDRAALDTAALAGPAGIVGYCMSGPFAYAMAGWFPERIAAAASIYGVRLHGEGSPQALASNIIAELYFACAELDEFVPAEMVDGLEDHLAECGKRARIERYAGVRHGFAFPSRVGAYDGSACELHFERLFDLFARNLARGPSIDKI